MSDAKRDACTYFGWRQLPWPDNLAAWWQLDNPSPGTPHASWSYSVHIGATDAAVSLLTTAHKILAEGSLKAASGQLEQFAEVHVLQHAAVICSHISVSALPHGCCCSGLT